MGNKVIIIGISGASASGKTLLADTIINQAASDEVIILSEDSYYRDRSDLTFEERKHINYDHPESIDFALLRTHLNTLQRGENVKVPIYNYNEHRRSEQTKVIGGQKIIILEGILLFTQKEIRDSMDIRIFVDTALDVCFIRRLLRDMNERRRTMESVIEQYERTVRPMYFEFIEPSKQYADVIVPRGGENQIAIDMILSKMQNLLNEHLAT